MSRTNRTGITMPNAIVVPKVAISQGPLGPFVYLIEKDNVARARPSCCAEAIRPK